MHGCRDGVPLAMPVFFISDNKKMLTHAEGRGSRSIAHVTRHLLSSGKDAGGPTASRLGAKGPRCLTIRIQLAFAGMS